MCVRIVCAETRWLAAGLYDEWHWGGGGGGATHFSTVLSFFSPFLAEGFIGLRWNAFGCGGPRRVGGERGNVNPDFFFFYRGGQRDSLSAGCRCVAVMTVIGLRI